MRERLLHPQDIQRGDRIIGNDTHPIGTIDWRVIETHRNGTHVHVAVHRNGVAATFTADTDDLYAVISSEPVRCTGCGIELDEHSSRDRCTRCTLEYQMELDADIKGDR